MAADVVVSHELKSLQDELLVSRNERVTASAAKASASPGAAEPADTVEDRHLSDQLRELVNEVTAFVEEGETTISTHPVQSVIGAMLVGIMIGRLLGRR